MAIGASKKTILKLQPETVVEPAPKKSAFDGIIGSVTNNMKEKANEIVATLQSQL
jgi:hypothetical protein